LKYKSYIKSILLLVVICLLELPSSGQITFNRRYGLGATSCNFYSVAEVSDGFLVTGMKVDGSNLPYSVHLDAYGEVIEVHEFEYEGYLPNLYESALQWTPQGELVNVGHISDSSDVFQSVIYWFDETGDTLRTRRDYSDIVLNDIEVFGQYPGWYTPRDLTQDEEGNLYELSQWGWPFGVVRKRDSDGELLWTFEFETDEAASELFLHNLSYYDGRIYFNTETGYWWDPSISFLYELDANTGEVISEMELFDWSKDQHRQIFPVDNSYIVAGRLNHPEGFGSAPAVYRLSSEGEIVWEQIFGDVDPSFAKYCEEILKVNSDEYVCACTTFQEDPMPEESFGIWNETVTISKFTQDGSILWSREYTGFDRPFDRHTLHSLIHTSDGGFAFCGVSQDWNEEDPEFISPPVQGWLVKLDEFGCLEPGCQFLDIEQYSLDSDGSLKVYPNPSNGTFKLEMNSPSVLNSSEILITDLSGRTVHQELISAGQSTLQIQHLSSGLYQVHWIADGILIDSEQVVVQ
jgi:hypothetical protein